VTGLPSRASLGTVLAPALWYLSDLGAPREAAPPELPRRPASPP